MELADLQNWMYGGDTIISESEKVISGKQLSKPIKGFTNQLLLRLSWLSMESQVSRSLVQVSRSSVLGRPLFKAEDVE